MEKRSNSNSSRFAGQKESVSHKVGDKIEKVGQKVSNSGAQKLGNAISKAGDKIEHMNDKKDVLKTDAPQI